MITHFFESHGGGIEKVAGHVCRNLAALGHVCEWGASSADRIAVDPAFDALPLECINPTERLTGLPMPILGPKGLARLTRAIDRADVVIVHDALYCTSIAATLIAHTRKVPVILFQHIATIDFPSPIMRKLMILANSVVTRPMLRAADQVIFISEATRKAFADDMSKRPVQTIFNGVDGATFYRGPASRMSLGLPESGEIVAFVGRFVEKKGLAVLEAVARQRPNLTFALAGSGPIEPLQWGLSNVHVLGNLEPGRVADLFRAASTLLLPSVGEGFPLVVQEAMACGLPVICGQESAQADPGARCWLQGVKIDLREIDATASRVCAALDRQPLSSEERAAMAAYATSNYRWSRMAEKVAAIAASVARENAIR